MNLERVINEYIYICIDINSCQLFTLYSELDKVILVSHIEID